MNRPRILSCLALVVALALPPVSYSPGRYYTAPRASTITEATAALGADLARMRAQLRRQQQEVAALSLRLSPALHPIRP